MLVKGECRGRRRVPSRGCLGNPALEEDEDKKLDNCHAVGKGGGGEKSNSSLHPPPVGTRKQLGNW